MTALIILGAAATMLAAGLFLIVGRPRARPPLLRFRGRVAGPGAPGELVQLAGDKRGFDAETDGPRYRVLGQGARLGWGKRSLRVGDFIEVDGVALDVRRDDQLYREPAVEVVVDALRITPTRALLRRRAVGVALVGAAALVGSAALFTLLQQRRAPGCSVPAQLRRLVAEPLRCPPGTSLHGGCDGGWHELCVRPGGRSHGPAREASPWGLAQGEYREGLREGRWLEREADGGAVEKHYRAGKLDGAWTVRGPSGRLIRQLSYREERMDGTVLEWDDAGRLQLRAQYRRGVPHGRHEAWLQGKLVESGEYRDGLREGDWSDADCVEEVLVKARGRCRQSFRAGKLQGPAVWWFGDGRRVEGELDDGSPTGAWRLFSPEGTLLQEAELSQGYPHGRWVWYGADGKREERFVWGKREPRGGAQR